MATGETHDSHIVQVLGLHNQRNAEAIQKAVYLVLDATDSVRDSDKIAEALHFLKQNYDLRKDITLKEIVSPNSEHQWYTHMGWDYDYSKVSEEGWTPLMLQAQQKKYMFRKGILLHAIKYIFPGLSGQKINSFAAFLYYVHITGDLRWNETPEYLPTIPELQSEFSKHLGILFGEKAEPLIAGINATLKGVKFEEIGVPLDRVFSDLFKVVPGLVQEIESAGQ